MATAFPHRTPGYNMLVAGEWMDPADTAVNTTWARDTYAAMSAHFASGRYANYLNTDEVGDRSALAAAFGPERRASPRAEAPIRPRQRVPSQPEHQALTGRVERACP